jgi:sporulation protein YlmC with PRC-barrel domain
MTGTFSSPPGSGSSSSAGDDRSPGDPVSWLQIEQGWDVVTTDGVTVGKVAQTEGDKKDDIFDGLAIEDGTQTRYVPGENVGQIFPGRVTLKMKSSELGALQPFRAPPPETTWTPGKTPLSARLSHWLRGKR